GERNEERRRVVGAGSGQEAERPVREVDVPSELKTAFRREMQARPPGGIKTGLRGERRDAPAGQGDGDRSRGRPQQGPHTRVSIAYGGASDEHLRVGSERAG